MRCQKILGALAVALASWTSVHGAWAADLPTAAAPIAYTELRFADFYKLPIGPRGLEASRKLQSLHGQPVRMVGYMAHQDGETAVPGLFILSPLPVTLGDEDESFADDLPASVLYVHPTESSAMVTYQPGLLAVHGTLEVGPQAEPDGRISFVRLRLQDAAAPIAAVATSSVSTLESSHVPSR
jgi:hypothetical protein